MIEDCKYSKIFHKLNSGGEHFHLRNDKSDLKGSQTNFETLLYKYLSQSDTFQLESA